MKIIFNNDEEKENFIKRVVDEYCPSIFGLPDIKQHYCRRHGSCDDCWNNCGLEMEVSEHSENASNEGRL